jgi:ethanolamine utilization microcompartment shell protein EutS
VTRKHHSAEYKTRITADLGAEVRVDCVALISITPGAGAIVQARLANVANFSVTLVDTGLLNAEVQDESQGNVVLVLQAPVMARYLRVDLTDRAAPYIDSGCLLRGSCGGC